MAKISEDVEICGTEKRKTIKAMFDSGSTKCLVDPEVLRDLGVKYTGHVFKIKLANGEFAEVKEAELVSIKVLGCERRAPRVYELEGLPEKMIIGQDFMQEMGVILRMREETTVLERCEPSIGYAI